MTTMAKIAQSSPSGSESVSSGILVDLQERRLVQQAMAGDGRAFAALVGPHLPMLLRVAARVSGDGALAEDAVQESLDIAYRRLGDLSKTTPLRAFIAGIVVKRAKTLARSERRRRLREQRSEQNTESVVRPGPHERIDLQRAMQEALDGMSDKSRAAVVLRLDAGLSHGEIAEEIGSTERSVRVLVHRAMGELRKKLMPLLGAEQVRGERS